MNKVCRPVELLLAPRIDSYVLVFAVFLASIGLGAAGQVAQADELKITVGKPTKLCALENDNRANLSVSRTGVVAAFYTRYDKGSNNGATLYYRTSRDGGTTWSKEGLSPSKGSACGTALREGGVIRVNSANWSFKKDWPLLNLMVRYNDDFSDWTIEAATVNVPEIAHSAEADRWASGLFDKGKMIQLADGHVLSPMYGPFVGDGFDRTMLVESSDLGRTWNYYSTVATATEDLNPELPGEFAGFCEPSIAMLGNGQMLCVMRTQHSHLPPDYKPMYVAWSDDLGKTWTKPVPTEPHLMNIWPTLQVLDNGVVACVYGRPGFHVAFSTDNGHTWGNRISLSQRAVDLHTGQEDMIKVGPNKLLAIGSVEGGTKVFPITVERVKDPRSGPFDLVGRVLDDRGKPIAGATVEYGPNRYTTDYRPILAENGRPTVKTDGEGRFVFQGLKRGETMLTVEAEGYMPTLRHVKAEPGMKPVDFRLKAGHTVRGRVIDEKGKPVAGVCVIIGDLKKWDQYVDNADWHVHTDLSGRFALAFEGGPRESAKVRLLKYNFVQLNRTFSLAQIQRQPIVMHHLNLPGDGREVPCTAVESPPAIDAGFDDEVWRQCPPASDLKIRLKSVEKDVPIKARFAYDKNRLRGGRLYAIVKIGPAEGIHLTDEDMIELSIRKNISDGHDRPALYQFAYNVEGRIPGRFAWNTSYTKNHSRREADGGWTVSTSLTWLVLQVMEPVPGTTFDLGLTHVQALDDNDRMGGGQAITLPTVFRYGRLVLK